MIAHSVPTLLPFHLLRAVEVEARQRAETPPDAGRFNLHNSPVRWSRLRVCGSIKGTEKVYSSGCLQLVLPDPSLRL